jgi:DNA modification methylase
MSNLQKLKVEYLDPHQILLDEKNARQHSDKQIKQIAESIRQFGFNVPVGVDKNKKAIAGAGRILGAKRLGITEIPVIFLAHLSPEQARAFAIADNRLSENSRWDKKLLGEALKDLSALDLDFSLEVTGFSTPEIEMHIDGAADAPDQKEESENLVPAVAPTAVSKPGNVWLLNKGRLLCGSAIDREAWKNLLQGKQVGLSFTDPPYNVKIDGHVSGKGRRKHREFAMASGEMDKPEYTDFLSQAFGFMARNSKSGAIHFICGDWRHVTEYVTAGNEHFAELKNICVWKKPNAGMGSLYRSQHELVFVFKHGAAKHVNNIELGKHGRSRTNVWEYSAGSNLGQAGEETDLVSLHPTVKPVALVADAIRDCSARGDIVLDPFIGSGTTLIAATRMGRVCYGIELDPLYVDVAIRRWQRFTGDHAVLESTGRRFDDIEGDLNG